MIEHVLTGKKNCQQNDLGIDPHQKGIERYTSFRGTAIFFNLAHLHTLKPIGMLA